MRDWHEVLRGHWEMPFSKPVDRKEHTFLSMRPSVTTNHIFVMFFGVERPITKDAKIEKSDILNCICLVKWQGNWWIDGQHNGQHRADGACC